MTVERPYVVQAAAVRGLAPITRSVLITLAVYADANDEVFPSVQTLASDTGVSKRSVQTALATLKSLGLVTTDSSFNSKTPHYFLFLEGAGDARVGAADAEGGAHGARGGAGGAPNYISITSNSVTSNTKSTSYSWVGTAPDGSSRREAEDSYPWRSEQPADNRPADIQPADDDQPIDISLIVKRGYPSKKETTVPMPGFENETTTQPTRRNRQQVDDYSSPNPLAEEKAEEQKPVAKWNSRDLLQWFKRQSWDAAPGIQGQVPPWAQFSCAKWLKEGVSPEVVHLAMEWFFLDKNNLREVGQGRPLWNRFQIYFSRNQVRATTYLEHQNHEYQEPAESLDDLFATPAVIAPF